MAAISSAAACDDSDCSGGLSAEVEEELDVLQSIFSEDEITVSRRDGRAVVHVRCFPAGVKKFVEAQLQLTLSRNYPFSEPPGIYIAQSQGLAHEGMQALLSSLRRELESTWEPPDAACFLLIERARDTLDALNSQARCHICLDKLLHAPEPRPELIDLLKGVGGTLRTHCAHDYHRSCLAHWWSYCALNREADARRQQPSSADAAQRDMLGRVRVTRKELEGAEAEATAAASLRKELYEATRKGDGGEDEKGALKRALREADRRVARGGEAVRRKREQVGRAEAALAKAAACAEAACLHLQERSFASIPCPTCRTFLHLRDTDLNLGVLRELKRRILSRADDKNER
jgi:hypothetical protein